jgi:hypothetical protein
MDVPGPSIIREEGCETALDHMRNFVGDVGPGNGEWRRIWRLDSSAAGRSGRCAVIGTISGAASDIAAIRSASVT